jgi:hypothetical protein
MMMKKLFLIIIFIFHLGRAYSQSIYKGVGIFGALTQSAHYYKNLDTDKKGTDTVYKYYYPQTHISKEFFSWGAGIFVELSGRDDIRWQTELEYANKGANEMELVNAYTGDRTGVYTPNKFTYIQWNNYAKFYNPIGNAHWYIMPGIRLEYLFKSAPTVFIPVSSNFPQFWFSGDIGLGYEFHLFKKFSAFIEYHWNPDIIPHTHDNTRVRNRTLELRAGIVMRPRKKQIDDCNAPVYRGPAY